MKRVVSDTPSTNTPTKVTHKMDYNPTPLSPEETKLVTATWERRVGSGPEAHLVSAQELIQLLERLGINGIGGLKSYLEKVFAALTRDARDTEARRLFFGQFVDVLQRCKTLAHVVQARKLQEAWKDLNSPLRSRHVESIKRSRHVDRELLTPLDLCQAFGALSNLAEDANLVTSRSDSPDVSMVLPAGEDITVTRQDTPPMALISLSGPQTVSAQRLEEFARQYRLQPEALIPSEYLVETDGTAAAPAAVASSSHMLDDGPLSNLSSPDTSPLAADGPTSIYSLEGGALEETRSDRARPGSPRSSALNPKYRNQLITTDELVRLLGADELNEFEDESDEDEVDVWANNPHSVVLDTSNTVGLTYWQEAEALQAEHAPPKPRKGDHGASLHSGLMVQPVDEFLTLTQRKSAFSSQKEPNPTTVLFNKKKAERQRAAERGEVLRVPTRAEQAERLQLQRERRMADNEVLLAKAAKLLQQKLPSIKSTR